MLHEAETLTKQPKAPSLSNVSSSKQKPSIKNETKLPHSQTNQTSPKPS